MGGYPIQLSEGTWYNYIMQTLNKTPKGLSTLCRKKKSDVVIKSDASNFRYYFNAKTNLAAGRVRCQESCQQTETVANIAQCKTCPCTVLHPLDSMWHYELEPVFDIQKGCTHSQTSQNILMVGLGAGSIVHSVKSVCNVRMMHVIELDEESIQASKLFFGLTDAVVTRAALSDASGLQIFHGDGEYGVQLMAQNSSQRYDTVVVDCMVAGHIPNGCRSQTFMSSIAKLMKPKASIYQWTWPEQIQEVNNIILKNIGESTFMNGWVRSTKS